MTIEKNTHNGSLIASAIYNGFLVTRIYYGYTKKEVRQRFLVELNIIKESSF